MALFQKSVLNKHLNTQDKDVVAKAYKKFIKYFHNSTIQQNIRESKEEQFQEGFLRELFVNVFGYTLNPNANFNLTTELKNEKGAKKADGAILKDGNAIGVIELKGTKTKDLEKVRQQAFDYKANQTGCVYVITSNFEKLRFYINNAVEFEEFNLFTINEERFALLYLCLAKENVFNNTPLKIKEASIQEEEQITKQFYTDYSLFKRELFRDLVKLNMKNEAFRSELALEDVERANKNIKHTLFKKSQKLIDRFLFIFFAEDRGLLPPNSTLKILEQWNKLKELDEVVPLYSRYRKYFSYLDQGRKGTDKTSEIFAYNGGLFKPDGVLDSLIISDDLLYKHTKDLAHYDFDSQVDVNILGHIFENSLNEIESVNAEIEGTDFDKQKTKRKKDGVFYTPNYITKYIVDNTVGKLCEEKKEELDIVEEEYHPKRQKDTKKKLLTALETYREWLLQLTILDPACGSGAFLNQALDFLIKEHDYIDELQTNLLGGGFKFPNIENTVLENNIFGVDINEESVDIARLSLWLRTAQPRRKLNNLSSNIKCGNSLIDSKAVAGDKAFKWEEEFAHIFKEKEKKAWHITTATHDSRTSQRMIDHKVRLLRDNGTNPRANPIWLEEEDEVLIAKTIAEIVKEDELNVMAFNVCGDHIHLLLVCEEEQVSKIIQKIKAKTSRAVNINKGITKIKREKSESDMTREHAPLSNTRGKKQNSLWTQKFGNNPIKDEEQLWNTLEYVQKNRVKHKLPEIKELTLLIEKMCCSYEHAFRTEKKGGFDVVIGNPPYVLCQPSNTKEEILAFYKTFEVASYKIDLFHLFFEKSIQILNKNGLLGFITPNTYLNNKHIKPLRAYILRNTSVEQVINYKDIVFEDAGVDVATLILRKNNSINKKMELFEVEKSVQHFLGYKHQKIWIEDKENLFNLNKEFAVDFKDVLPLGDLSTSYFGIQAYDRKTSIANNKLDENHLPLIDGGDINSFSLSSPKKYFNFLPEKIKSGGDFTFYQNKRIVISQIGATPIVGVVEGGVLGSNTLYNINMRNSEYSLNYLLCILNSNLLKQYWLSKYSDGKKLFPKIKGFQLKELPIKTATTEQQQLFIKQADVMLNLNRTLQRLSSSFQNYLQSQFHLDKLSKKLQDWHELDFGDFIKELNKAIKKAGTSTDSATKLSKMDEMEWMEVFETKKTEAQTLKAQIDKTDAEIDVMVYELYGLSEEEIKIVEGS